MKVIGYSRLRCKIIYLPSEGLITHKKRNNCLFLQSPRRLDSEMLLKSRLVFLFSH